MSTKPLPHTLCKHEFPTAPPHGSTSDPGDCTLCGTTWYEQQLELDAARTAHRAATARTGRCPICRQPDRLLFIFIQQPRPGTDAEPQPSVYLCGPDWSATTQHEERAIANSAPFSITTLQERAREYTHTEQQTTTKQQAGPGPLTLNGGIQPELAA